VKNQVCEQGLGTRRVQRRHAFVPEAQLEATQPPDTQNRPSNGAVVTPPTPGISYRHRLGKHYGPTGEAGAAPPSLSDPALDPDLSRPAPQRCES
jgi:hypothetical protein